MPFAITYRGEMSEPSYRHYLMLACRWLLTQNVAFDHVPRVREQGRWLLVFDRREDAESVLARLFSESQDDDWELSPVEETPDVGPIQPLTFEIGWGSRSVGFGLNDQVIDSMRLHYPDAVPHYEVWIKTDQKWAFSPEGIRQLALEFLPFLTGLSFAQLGRFGGFEVVDPREEKVIVPFTPFATANGAGEREASPKHLETATSPVG